MPSRQDTISACKQEVRYRADYIHLDYDPVDICHWDLPDGYTVVLLTHIYLPQEEDETERVKDPTVYITYPSPMMNCFRPMHKWKIEVRTFMPTVRVRMPQLILIVGPDDRVITSDAIQLLENLIARIVEREEEGNCGDSHN